MIKIPFKPQKYNYIIVPGLIYRGSKQVMIDFLVDTGASITMVDPYIMQSIGYTRTCAEHISPASVSSPAGKEEGYHVKAHKMLIHSQQCVLQDIDIICIRPEQNVEALLGLNFLSKFRYCIDHKKHVMTLEPA
jgi:predicted aspartyl protease